MHLWGRAERDHAVAGIRDRILRAIARGELPKDADAVGLSRTIGALVQGMSVQARDGATYDDLAPIADSARTLLAAAGHQRGVGNTKSSA